MFDILQVMRSETMRLQHEQNVMKEKIRDNAEKIKQNKVLPYLVGNVVEVCSPPASFEIQALTIARYLTSTQMSRRTVQTKT